MTSTRAVPPGRVRMTPSVLRQSRLGGIRARGDVCNIIIDRTICRVAMPSSSAEEEAVSSVDKAGDSRFSHSGGVSTSPVFERTRLIDILRGVSSTHTDGDVGAVMAEQRDRPKHEGSSGRVQGNSVSSRMLKEAQECLRKPAIRIVCGDDGRMVHGVEEEPVVSWIKPVLHWLYVSPTDIPPHELANLASTYAYDQIHVIDVGSMSISEDAITDGVSWMGASRFPSGPVCVSSFLNRLKHRFTQRYNDGKSIVILTFSPSTSYLTLHALALFFFMHCWIDERNARSLAAGAVGKQIPPVSIIDSGVEELAACGKGWLQRVIVEWPYHARSSVDIAGEICGGWHITRRLRYDVSNRKWKIQIWGLPPGAYTFKFVVDGHWCVDLKKPLSVDEWGNDNNTATVIACGGLDSNERLQERRIAENSDGMAASYIGEYDVDESDKRMIVVVEPNTRAIVNSSEDRLRLARFGASLLSYYKKISYHGGALRTS